MSALIVYIGGETSPRVQEALTLMVLKLSDVLAQEQIDLQDAKDAQQRIATLEGLSTTQQVQIGLLTAQNQAALDAGFDPVLLQQIADTANAIHTTLHGAPADTSSSAATDTAVTTAPIASPDSVDSAPLEA